MSSIVFIGKGERHIMQLLDWRISAYIDEKIFIIPKKSNRIIYAHSFVGAFYKQKLVV